MYSASVNSPDVVPGRNMRDVWKLHLHFYMFVVMLVQVHADAYILKLGQNVTLNCTAANNTSADIKHVKWIKDGANVASFSDTLENQVTVTDPSKFVLSLPSYTLTIKSAAEEDKGLYNCTVEHTDGNTTSSTIAVAMPVTGAPVVTSTSPRTSTPSTSAGASVSARVSTSSVTSPSSITVASSTLQTDKPSGTTSSPKLPVVPGVNVDPGSSPSTPGSPRGIEPPGQPVALKVTATTIKLSWTPSQVNDSKVNYTVNVSTSSGSWSKSSTYTTHDTELVVRRLIPDTEYFFQVKATDAEGNSVTGPQSDPISTRELKPDQKVTNLRGEALNGTAIFVSWVGPNISVPNHIKWGYFLSYRETNSSRRAASNLKLKRSAQNATISGLLPLTLYKVQVLVYYDFGSGRLVYGDWRVNHTQTTEGAAPVPVIDRDKPETTAYSIGIAWTVPSPPVARILGFRIYYCLYSTCPSNKTVIEVGDVRSYVIKDLQPSTFYMVSMESFNSGSTSSRTRDFPVNTDVLPPTKTPPPVQTTSARTTVEVDNSSGTGAIIGIAIALGAFLVILLVLAAVYFRKFHQTACYYIDDDGSPRVVKIQHIPLPVMLDGENSQSIAVGQFAKHVSSLHADSDHGFALEYEEIHQSTANRSDLKWEHTMHPDNKHKNRYINIVAYDHSRVQLKPVLGRQKHSDYINANFVDGYEKARKFIAAQGPLKATFGDFWRMVWEQNTAVIIMLTNLVERGRRKCDQYWPTDGTEQYGLVTVTLKHTKVLANYTIRTFSLRHAKVKKGKAERTVLQYHYTQWPDHGTPDYALPVLTFIRKSAAVRGGEDVGPMVVHCSAGVGRTGTYIVLDTMMRQVEEKHSVNIKGFLKHIRTQRNYLVQTEEQYIFCHDALLKFIQCRDTEIAQLQLHHYMDELLKPGRSGRTLLDKHFKHMMAHQAEEFEYYCAQKPCNTKKNRTQKLLPVEGTRVSLTAKPGMEGSDYINASYLQGYSRSKEFIITQHPLLETVKDFWQMIWDQNSPAVVMLSKPDENDNLPSYWPSKDKPMECVTFKVSLQDEKEEKVGNDNSVTVRSFLLEATQDDYVLEVRHFQSPDWPAACTAISDVFHLVNLVQEHAATNEGPITVHDVYGGVSAATFCGLTALKHQLEDDGSMDIFQLAKTYHMMRPGIFSEKDQYLFLYKAMQTQVAGSAENGDIITVDRTDESTESLV